MQIDGVVHIGTAPPVTIDNPYLVVGSNDGGLATLGATGDTAATNSTSVWSIVALLKGIFSKLLGTLTTTVSNFPAVQPVAVNNFPASQLVSVSNSPVVSVSNFPPVQPVSFLTGRQQIALVWERLAAVIVESSPVNFTSGTRGGVNLSASSSYTVSAGKTFRIQSVSLLLRVTTAKADFNSRVRIRQGTLNTSPIIWQGELATSGQGASLVESGVAVVFSLPNGLEISSGQSIVVTHLDSSAGGTVSVSVIGFEY